LSIDLHSSLIIEHLLYFNFEKYLSCGATDIQVFRKGVKQKDKIGRDAKKKSHFTSNSINSIAFLWNQFWWFSNMSAIKKL